MTALRAVLFDLDGTLLDTAPDMIGALNALRTENQLGALPAARVRPAVSHGSSRLVQLGFPDAIDQRFVALQRRFLEIYAARLSAETRLFEGMDRVLEQLASRRLAVGIVTNKPAHLTEPLLDNLGLRGRFACIVSGDSLPERKPHPLPMLHAAALAGAAPEECLYVGDAERDVQAAHGAGMQALVATYGYLGEDEDWRIWGADGFIERPLDLIAWLGRRGSA
ncbi:MAG: HAD-IA family hydrolase [Steroidobacteraceae bacterium]|jgi:phosphoglycolate phosphatase